MNGEIFCFHFNQKLYGQYKVQFILYNFLICEMEMQPPEFFKSVNELHKWFQKNHNKIAHLWIGFYTVK